MRDRLISFADLYRALSTFTDEFTYFTVIDMINDLPTVDAKPVRHGRWVHNKWSNMRHDYSCSLCGCRIEGVDPFSLSATTYNYCPECGAVMDGVEE